jgi:hypothetical protein
MGIGECDFWVRVRSGLDWDGLGFVQIATPDNAAASTSCTEFQYLGKGISVARERDTQNWWTNVARIDVDDTSVAQLIGVRGVRLINYCG